MSAMRDIARPAPEAQNAVPASEAQNAVPAPEAQSAMPAPEAQNAMPAPEARYAWSVAVFGRNEAASIADCLRAIAQAGQGQAPHVTVLLNGTTDDSPARAAQALRDEGLPGRVYDIPHGDKSHAVNLFLHDVRPRAETYFCVDAYARMRPDALRHLAASLAARPAALAAAAMPSTGRSAAALRRMMLDQSGLHGSLFALRGGFVDRLVAAGLRLPVGLYRGDGMLGAFVLHDLDAAQGGWDTGRIAMTPEASWTTSGWQPWRWRDLRRHLRRLVQQGRGRLESAAMRSVIYAGGFPALPARAETMVLAWIAADAAARTPRLWRDPFAWLALARLRQSGVPAPDSLRPRLLWRSEGA